MSIRRGLLSLTMGLLAMLAVTLSGAPAQATSPGFAPINRWNSSHCLDNATQNDATLQMWSCSGATEQNWSHSFTGSAATFVNQHTGRCITAPAVGAGTVTMQFCNSTATTQHWTVFFADNPLGAPSGWYDVWKNVSSGLCLSTPSVGNGTLLQTSNCDASDLNDRWHLQ